MPIFTATFDPQGILRGVNQAKTSVRQLGASLDDMGKQGNAATNSLGQSFGTLAKSALALFGAYKSFDWAKGAVLAAGRYEALGMAMYQVGKNAGYSHNQMDSFDASLQRTGIAMKESRQLLTMLAGANLDLTQSADLARIAQDAAGISGRNSSQAFESLVRGITTGQTELLRNIGIQVDFEAAYAKMAKTLNKTTAALSTNEKMQAKLDATKEAGIPLSGAYEALMESSFKRMGSLTRHFDNIQVLAGEMGMGVFSDLIDEVDELAKGTEGWLKSLKEAGALEDVGNTIGDHFKTGAITVGAYTTALILSRSEIGANISALIQKSKQTQLTALATYNAAQQELVLAQAQNASLIQQRNRISTIQQHTALNNSLAVSNARVTAATAKMTQAQFAASKASRGLGIARGALNALGGPWVLGLTAAAAGVALLSSRETAAEFVSRKYADSLREVNKELRGIEGGTQSTADFIAERTLSQLGEEREKLQKAQRELASDIANMIPAPLGDVRTVQVAREKIINELLAYVEEVQKIQGDHTRSIEDRNKEIKALMANMENSMEVRANEMGMPLNEAFQRTQGAIMATAKGMDELNIRTQEFSQASLDKVINQFESLGAKARATVGIFGTLEYTMAKLARAGMPETSAGTSNGTEGNDPPASSYRGASSYDEKAAAVKNAENELARLIHTEIEYKRLQRDNQIKEWQDKGVSPDLTNRYYEATEKAFNKAAISEATREIQDFEREYQSAMGNVKGLTGSITSQMKIYREASKEAFESGVLGANEYYEVLERIQELENRKILESSRRLSSGVSLAFKDYERDATNAASGAYTAMSNSLTGMEDALVHFAQTGKLEFGSLINMMIADLARLTIQQSITGPIFNALGSVVSGLMPSLGGWNSGSMGQINNAWNSGASYFAKGGVFGNNALSRYSNSVVSKPTYFAFAQGGIPNRGLMGEAGPEAIMPLSRTSSGDLGVKVQGASAPNFTMTVIDQRGKNAPPIETQQTPNANGGMDIKMIIQGEVVKALGNGAADTAMRTRYALRPQAGGN